MKGTRSRSQYCFWKFILLSALFLNITIAHAQSGNQMLDGIGETDLISRYLFSQDTRDWSRNNLHASIKGGEANFVSDKKFKSVLSFGPNSNAYIELPGTTIKAEESISISGWIFMEDAESDQYIIDFGKDASSHHLYIAPNGFKNKKNIQVGVVSSSKAFVSEKLPAWETGKWTHIALVLNTATKTLTTFLNGNEVQSKGDIDFLLNQVFDEKSPSKNKLFIGKSIQDKKGKLHAKLFDFRVYRIALSDNQVKRIYKNALSDGQTTVNERPEKENDMPKFADNTAQLYNQFLEQVPNITVETATGHLPQLPRYVDGVYKDRMKGPKVRVLWPAPKDNSEVAQAGQYEIIGSVSGSDVKPQATIVVKNDYDVSTPEQHLKAFSLQAVSLNANKQGQKTKFIENRDKFISTLAQTNPDAFLYMFRDAFGQDQPEGAEPLGVWDSQETKLRGHATGHYLTAIVQAYASTAYDKKLQENFADKMRYMVNTLYDLAQLSGSIKEGKGNVENPSKVPQGVGREGYDSQLSADSIRTDYWNWGKGFISAYPPDQFIMLEHGATYGTKKSQIWAPYYTLHKILAGLMDIYEISGNEKALAITKGMGDWVHARLSELPTDTLISMWNRYIAGEFGGMNEAMARLSRLTSDPKYLETAELFDNIKVFYGNAEREHGLAKNVDTYRGLHANQHIPQIVGALETYRNSNLAEYYHVANNFWYKTVNDYMYSIGGVAGARNPANVECFVSQPATLYENGFSAGGQNETCATYNMLKLTRNLFFFDQRSELMDYYERGLYNHILASVAADSPANTYHVPLRPGSMKHFGNAEMKGFTCCNGTALESSTKLQNSIYFKSSDNSSVYVNLFVPSTLNWVDKKINIQQITSFPNEQQTKLVINGKGRFKMKVRVPSWATTTFIVEINGKDQKVEAIPGSYITLDRKWNNGDEVTIKMPFEFHLDPIMDQQNIASLFYGPILLVAQENEPRKDWRKITLNANDLGKTISGDPSTLNFTIEDVVLKPFYETYGRHSVYLDITLN
ncbi:MAG: hypothetical protein CML05_15875 [Pseudozobellia sp.]|nr:hypothetical protein [Pseudozobellia sp.]